MTPAELKAARKTLGLSADKLARLVGVYDGSTVRRWERGKPDAPHLVQVMVGALLDLPELRAYLGLSPKPSRQKRRARSRATAATPSITGRTA